MATFLHRSTSDSRPNDRNFRTALLVSPPVALAGDVFAMVRVTDPEKSRAFYEALGFRFSRDMDIVRNGELEATNYFYSIGDAENVPPPPAAPSWLRRLVAIGTESGL